MLQFVAAAAASCCEEGRGKGSQTWRRSKREKDHSREIEGKLEMGGSGLLPLEWEMEGACRPAVNSEEEENKAL